MKKLLWISKSVPYDSVPHAGGKTHNYYVKQIAKNGKVDITLVSMAKPYEVSRLDLDKYKIKNKISVYKSKHDGITWICWRIVDSESVINPFNRNGGLTRNYEEYAILKNLTELKAEGYVPEFIILEWTQITLLIDRIKSIYPNAPVLGIEVDVAFLGYYRKWKAESLYFKQLFLKQKYRNLKRSELAALNKLNIVAVNNIKDRHILIDNGIAERNIIELTPYYDSYIGITRMAENNNIIFYGAMSREENWKSAIWFIEKVMPLIADVPIHLLVIGNKPPEILKKYESNRVTITGFVDDVTPYFTNALCMVCPLLLGAGVKVKVIEGMSAGLPVLANEVAIEGINAVDQKDYLFCSVPDDYAREIKRLYNNISIAIQIGSNARNYIKNNFSYENDVRELEQIIINGSNR